MHIKTPKNIATHYGVNSRTPLDILKSGLLLALDMNAPDETIQAITDEIKDEKKRVELIEDIKKLQV